MICKQPEKFYIMKSLRKVASNESWLPSFERNRFYFHAAYPHKPRYLSVIERVAEKRISYDAVIELLENL